MPAKIKQLSQTAQTAEFILNVRGVLTGKYPRRVSRLQGLLMLGTAGLIDLVQLALNLLAIGVIINRIISIIMVLVFWFWFILNQVSYWSGRKAGAKVISVFGGAVAELIPVIDTFPAWLASVGLTIFFSWSEDLEIHQERLAAEAQAQAQVAQRQCQQENINQEIEAAAEAQYMASLVPKIVGQEVKKAA